jgi:hypothetical protein
MHLTLEEWEALPCVSGRRAVTQISAVHLHAHLPRAPATVVVDGTHCRISKSLRQLAVNAFLRVGPATPPAPGRLVDVLRAMGGGEADAATSVGDDDEEPSESPDPLDLLAEKLAREALAGLQVATGAAVGRLYAERRGALMDEALRALSVLD